MLRPFHEVYRRELGRQHPDFGYPLWQPDPGVGNEPVAVGDVGFIRMGRFIPLFNVLLDADNQSHKRFGVPADHQPFLADVPNHIVRAICPPNTLHSCNSSMMVAGELFSTAAANTGFMTVSYRFTRKDAATLSVPVNFTAEDTNRKDSFGELIAERIDSWFAFTQRLKVGVKIDEIIVVTGCHRSRAWVAQAVNNDRMCIFGSKHYARGVFTQHGPSGDDLPENQTLFIRGFRVKRSLGGLFSQVVELS